MGTGTINDVRIENDFIAVAAYRTMIELELDGLTPIELWRTTSDEWYRVVFTDLSEDGNYVCYLAQRYSSYENAGEVGVLQGGGLISKHYTSGYRPTNFWIDASGDMEYIAASRPIYPPYPWFIIKNSGESGYEIVEEGTMSDRIDDLDSNSDASMLAFGSDSGEFLLLKRSGNTIETVFDEDIGMFIDAIEVGETSLLVGGSCFINVYIWNRPPVYDDAYADPGCLWSPNHKFVAIDILGVTDPDGDPVTITITGIISDEPTASDEGAGGAKHAPDAAGVGEDMAQVRAERSGGGNGRVYEISFIASDDIGGECEGSVIVCVPHDQGGEYCECIDDGQIYDAKQIN